MEINSKQLKNGTNYLNIFDNNSQTVTILCLFKVGSRYEKSAVSGIAHFVEHNFFKGTKNLPTSKDIGIAIESLGGSSNAFTSYEYTGYYIKAPKENFQKATVIIADLLKNATFPEAEVIKERGVIIEEIRMYEDIPRYKVSSLFMEELFKNHPLGRDIAGSVETVSKMDRNTILEFTDQFYTPANLLLVVSGGIEFNDSLKTVVEGFELDSKVNKTNQSKKFKQTKITSNTFTKNKKLEQTHIVMGGLGIKRSDPRRHAVNLGIGLLSSGFGSILFQNIREKLGVAYYVGADHSSFEDIGYWDISMGVEKNKVDIAIKEVKNEMKQFLDGNFTETDFSRAKSYLLGNLVTDLESSDEWAYMHGIQQLLLGRLETVEEIKTKIKELTKEEVLKVWNEIYKEEETLMYILE